MECPRYYSQDGQDEFVANNLLAGKENGFFVEIGAYDGVSLSNTYFLEKYLGWNGICIEPVLDAFVKLQQVRNCICVNGCISDKEGVADFYHISGGGKWTKYCSGLVDYYSPKHEKIIEDEIREHGGSKEILQVECYQLEKILKKHNIKRVDYLSIDVEGAELEILKTIDFESTFIDVISVENLHFEEAIKNHLENVGYEYIKKIGFDEMYKRKQ